MTKRITALVEQYNFARMLEHAGDDAAALRRVESTAQSLGVDLEQVKPLLTMDATAKAARRQALLLEVDALQAEYGAATGAGKAELAEQISSKQLEANYFSYEANIGPGSIKLSGVRGLEMQESYQAALTQLEMIEHIMAESGGDVALASREYELFKYVGRFGDIAERAGMDSARLRYLRNQAKAVAGGQREMMEETAHQFLDARKVRATPPVTDEFLARNFEMFEAEARATLGRLNPAVARRAGSGMSRP
jgi:hypothetical protein